MKAITLASHSDEIGRGFSAKTDGRFASTIFWLIAAFFEERR
jgi:hypothetical protein